MKTKTYRVSWVSGSKVINPMGLRRTMDFNDCAEAALDYHDRVKHSDLYHSVKLEKVVILHID